MGNDDNPIDMIEHYQRSGHVIRWPIEPGLISAQDDPAIKYRNDYAKKMANAEVHEITASYLNMSPAGMDKLVELTSRFVLSEPFKGIGMELGAGTGLLSATLCKHHRIKAMLAIELCQNMTEQIIPKVAASILNDNARKVVPVVGSFNRLSVKENSIDFITEIGSFHHSNDLSKTLKSCCKVLKPGGKLLCFDRCQPDCLTDEELEKKLSQVYSKEFLINHGYPSDITLTRRDNGENEYRLFEWKSAFNEAGLILLKAVTFVRLDFKRAVKGFFSIFPRYVTHFLYKTEDADFNLFLLWLMHRLRFLMRFKKGQGQIIAHKDYTVFLLAKPE